MSFTQGNAKVGCLTMLPVAVAVRGCMWRRCLYHVPRHHIPLRESTRWVSFTVAARCGVRPTQERFAAVHEPLVEDEEDEDALLEQLVQGSSPRKRRSNFSVVKAEPTLAPPATEVPRHAPPAASPKIPPRNASPSPAPLHINDDEAVAACRKTWEVFARVQRTNQPQQPQENNAWTPVEWICMKCQSHNSINCATCHQCAAPHSASLRHSLAPARPITVMPEMWICQACAHANVRGTDSKKEGADVDARHRFFCQRCHTPFSGVSEWACVRCTTMNSRASTQCATCLTQRPAGWSCTSCNSSSQTSIFTLTCHGCGVVRPSSSSLTATRCCPQCSSRNDARSEICETCLCWLGEKPAFTQSAPPATTHEVSGGDGIGSCATGTSQGSPTSSVVAGADNSLFGPWWCAACNVLQRRNAGFCDICLKPRHLAAGKEEMGEAAPGSWRCPYCQKPQDVMKLECCGHARELPQGYWLCTHCCSSNRAIRAACLGCGQTRPRTPWTCCGCGATNGAQISFCGMCGGAHEHSWICEACDGAQMPNDVQVCSTCGGARPTPPATAACPVCLIPNLATRKGCHRCRTHFLDTWTCRMCGADEQDRARLRCGVCKAPRPFNLGEEIWSCELCNTPVSSGGDYPVMTRCPLCKTERGGSVLSFPSRWECRTCGIFNRTRSESCVECGTSRLLPTLRCDGIDCPHCGQQTNLRSSEACSHCEASLSDLITNSSSPFWIEASNNVSTLEERAMAVMARSVA